MKGKHICVFGGGNVAMDALRTALRLGCDDVKCVYRRGREELPARFEEIHHGEQEGIEFYLLHSPLRFIGDDDGVLKAVELQQMELGPEDESGRRRPQPVAGGITRLECDLAVVAIGSGANPLITKTTPNLVTNEWGYIACDKEGRTKKRAVWAGGDIVTGAATVIKAARAGRTAADSIHRYMCWGW